jgi:type I restriction enzyme S subunit
MAHSANELDIAWSRIQDNWSDLVQGLDGLDDLRDLALGITFSGRLTRTANLPQDEWDLTTLGDLCDVRDGTHDSPRKATTGYPLVTSKNLKKGLVDLEHSYLISENDYQEISRRSRVDKFDVLISLIGTVGQVAIVKDQPEYAIKNVGLIKTGSELLSRFIAYYLVSPQAKSHINAASSGGVQKFLSLGKLRALPISIPNPKVQEQVVLQLDQLMSVCEELEKNTIEADMLANRFTQSLLATSH